MNPINVFLLLLPLFVAVYAVALSVSRRGNSALHRQAFAGGLVGLLSLPVFLMSGFGLAAQFLFADWATLPGVMFIISGLGLVGSLMHCLVLLALLRRANEHFATMPSGSTGAAPR